MGVGLFVRILKRLGKLGGKLRGTLREGGRGVVASDSERRRDERRHGMERRGVLRWDPRRNERRRGGDRRTVRASSLG